MFDAKKFAQRILLSRRELDLDQKELGRQAGVSNTYISDIERGRAVNVSIEVILSLANALGIAPAYLIGLTDDPLSGIPNTDDDFEPLDNLAKELLEIYQQLPNDKRSILLTMAKVLRSAYEPRIIGSA